MKFDLDSPLNLPAIEDQVLAFWTKADVPARFATRNAGGPRWVTYEGPPTVNGSPALHHVFTSTYKDVYARFQTLRGKEIDRKGGWDCQGLPVEIAVERELGLEDKQALEAYGIAKFIERCRSTVERNVALFENVLQRIGYWVDYEHAYRTMDEGFIESVWWHLKTLWDKGLCYEGHKVVPYCVRCGTALSSHELGQPDVYQDLSHAAAFVGLRLKDSEDELVVWTTTPWTLVANVAVAVAPAMAYGRYQLGTRSLIVAVERADVVLPDATLLEVVEGTRLVGLEYERPYSEGKHSGANMGRVIGWDGIDAGTGTGLVHIAPAFGEDDADLGRVHALPVPNPIDAAGTYTEGQFSGRSVLDVSPDVIHDLASRGLLVRSEDHAHQYPHCWRCRTPLIYWAKATWFIRTSGEKQRFLEENEAVTWYPASIKHGRFGNWLRENVDWAVSRDRYWGTPLPVWRCPDGHDTWVASRQELSTLSGKDLSDVQVHRPGIDQVVFPCPNCGQQVERVATVCDVWLDSGCMPGAQWNHPLGDEEAFEANYPADFICEAIDQTRGWFYSLLAINTMVFGKGPYRNVVCLGHLVDDAGRKMSKSLGNVIDPEELIPRFGADGVRWYLLASGPPWGPRRISLDSVEKKLWRDLGTLWNVLSFYLQYAEIEGIEPTGVTGAPTSVLDVWLRSRLAGLVASVEEELEGYQAHRAADAISTFIDDLSNWYVRRSRRRYWGGEELDPHAFATLHEALRTLAVVMSPFCPFFGEALHQALADGRESVHLAKWPTVNPEDQNPALEQEMAMARRVSSIVRAARNEGGIGVRQPLRTAVVTGVPSCSLAIRSVISDEINVQNLLLGSDAEVPVRRRLHPNWSTIGPRFRELAAEVGELIEAAEDLAVIEALCRQESVTIELDGRPLVIEPGDVVVIEELAAGWLSAVDGDIMVALDTELDEELVRGGRMRNIIRRIQAARRTGGLAVTDRIKLWLVDELRGEWDGIAREVLAVLVEPLSEAPAEGLLVREDEFAFTRA